MTEVEKQTKRVMKGKRYTNVIKRFRKEKGLKKRKRFGFQARDTQNTKSTVTSVY